MSQHPDIIDVSGLESPDARALDRVASRLEAPCRELGLFHIVGHGLSADDLADFDAAMRRFFALPRSAKQRVRRTRDNAFGYYDEELTKNRPDWKEVFDYGREYEPHAAPPAHSDGVNRWPEGEPALRQTLIRHHALCQRVARSLLRALSVSLGLAPDRLLRFFEDDSSFVRLNHYPVCNDPAPPDADPLPEQGHLGVHPHSDAGALTLLYQDDVASLQAAFGSGFVLVEPVPGALTVNLGDMLRVWSNDRYRSPVHRVLARSDRPRYSSPFFLNPRYDAVCAPILDAPRANERARFRPVSWARFRDERSAGDFADYGTEIQVDHFLIGDREPAA